MTKTNPQNLLSIAEFQSLTQLDDHSFLCLLKSNALDISISSEQQITINISNLTPDQLTNKLIEIGITQPKISLEVEEIIRSSLLEGLAPIIDDSVLTAINWLEEDQLAAPEAEKI